jgi:hypothetical protein
MAIGEVTYTLSAFKRAGFVGRGGQLVLESGHEMPRAFEALAAVIMESNEAMVEIETRELWGQVNGPVPTPQGPMALVTECEPAKALTMVLDQIKGGLERRGISGRLRPAKTVQHKVFDNNSYRSLGALLMLPVDEDLLLGGYDPRERGPRPFQWLVSPELTRAAVTPLLDWVLEVDGPVYVWIGATQIELGPDAVVDFVCSTLPVDYMVAVRRFPDDSRLRRVCFSEYGGVTVQSFDPTQPREHHLAQLTGLLEQLAPHINAGLVREASTGTRDRQSSRGTHPSCRW